MARQSFLAFLFPLLLSVSSQAVWHGDEASWYPSTVGIKTGGTQCTAVVISSNWLLTAGHCVEGQLREKRISIKQGSGSAKTYQVAHIYPHPGYRDGFFENPSTSRVRYDLALIQLATSIDAPAAKLLGNRADVAKQLKAGTATVVGYGKSGYRGQKKRVAVLPAILTSATYIETSTNSRGQSICEGDSGGGLYVLVGGELYVIGINSVQGRIAGTKGKGSLCGSPNAIGAIASVFAEADWIRQTSGVQF